eukprot:1159142-Pelagomonas_calceolata.AAC.4
MLALQVSFEVDGDLWATARFIDNLRIPYIAPSLGGVESLIEMPAVQSYWSFGPEGRAQIGIKENLVRVGVVGAAVLVNSGLDNNKKKKKKKLALGTASMHQGKA